MIRSISLFSTLHFVQPRVLLANIAGVCCWLTFSPAGPPGPAPHPVLPSQGLGPSQGQDSDFVLPECREVPAEPVLPPALPSGVSTAPSPRSRRLGEGARYQKLTQKEKF